MGGLPVNLPPPNRWDIEQIIADRAHAIAACGFTECQARFLVTVMLHSGVRKALTGVWERRRQLKVVSQ
jgi:hypothetical protein